MTGPPPTSGTRSRRQSKTAGPSAPQTRRPALRAGDRVEPLDGELVVYDPDSGRAYLINRNGAALWGCCDGLRPVSALALELTRTAELPYETALADVEAFLDQLERAGLLAP